MRVPDVRIETERLILRLPERADFEPYAQMGWTEVIHCIDPDNHPSQAVALRVGSRCRGPGRMPLPHGDAVIDIWGQTRAEWQAHSLE